MEKKSTNSLVSFICFTKKTEYAEILIGISSTPDKENNS